MVTFHELCSFLVGEHAKQMEPKAQSPEMGAYEALLRANLSDVE